MKKTLLLIFLLHSLLHINTFSQADFQPAYIITNSLDTVYGFVDNRSYHLNSQYCDFKEKTNESVIRYYPDKLSGYRFIDGKYYVSLDIKGTHIFYEYLIKGELDIYFYRDKDKLDHYYASKDTLPIYELKYIEGVKSINGERTAYVSKPYEGYLNYLTNDCPEIKDEIPDLKIQHKNLIKFAENYHNIICEDNTCIVYEKKIPRKIKFSMHYGYNFLLPDKPENTREIIHAYGFQVMFQQSQDRERLYLGIGLYNDNQLSNPITRLRIPFSINYIVNKNGISPFYSYEIDMNNLMFSQAIKIGMKYQVKKVSASLHADLKTLMFINPYGYSLNFGLAYDLK